MRLLDTDVCIEILRGNSQVIDRRRQTVDQVATAPMTACELYYGAAKSDAPQSNRRVVDEFLATLDVLEMDRVATRRFGDIKATLEDRGQGLADADLLIASVALANGAIVVTGNRSHYDRIPGIEIEDWIRGDV